MNVQSPMETVVRTYLRTVHIICCTFIKICHSTAINNLLMIQLSLTIACSEIRNQRIPSHAKACITSISIGTDLEVTNVFENLCHECQV